MREICRVANNVCSCWSWWLLKEKIRMWNCLFWIFRWECCACAWHWYQICIFILHSEGSMRRRRVEKRVEADWMARVRVCCHTLHIPLELKPHAISIILSELFCIAASNAKVMNFRPCFLCMPTLMISCISYCFVRQGHAILLYDFAMHAHPASSFSARQSVLDRQWNLHHLLWLPIRTLCSS